MKIRIGIALLVIFSSCFIACNDRTHDQDSKKRQFHGPNPEEVSFSFAFVGCNRVQSSDIGSQNTNTSTANLPQLKRTFDEVAEIQPKPAFFFFLGDLVLGLKADTATLDGQLDAWKNQAQDPDFSSFAASGISLVAIPGNHEMLFQNKKIGNERREEEDVEHPWSAAISIWTQQMHTLMPKQRLNRVSGADSLINLQTYSFDFQNTHFIILNTDTWNKDSLIGTFPVDWVNADIQKARANKGTEHIFLLSHKPAYLPRIKSAEDVMDTTIRGKLWPVMEANQVEALISAHSHQYHRSPPNSNKSFQVVAGNGGSLYANHVKGKDQFMGYCVVYVMKNGDLILESMGRDIDAKDYLKSIPKDVKTTVRDSINLKWRSESSLPD